MVRGRRAEAPGLRSDVSFRLDQKTGNFKAAIGSRAMQWSVLAEKQKNQLAQAELRFIKTIMIGRAAAITHARSSRPHQRCTGAKDGKLQGGHSQQTYAVKFVY
jgi:hypothetical protein